MKKQRITIDELFNASRQKGISNLDNVDMVILETTGDITIIEKNNKGELSTVDDIEKKQGKTSHNRNRNIF